MYIYVCTCVLHTCIYNLHTNKSFSIDAMLGYLLGFLYVLFCHLKREQKILLNIYKRLKIYKNYKNNIKYQ